MPALVQATRSGDAPAPTIAQPHHVPRLVRPPPTNDCQNHVLEHLNSTLPKLAAQQPSRPYSALPSSDALRAHLDRLRDAHRQAQQNTIDAETTLRRQLIASLSSVKALRQRLEHLPDGIAATEDQLLDLCENLVGSSSSALQHGAPAESSRGASKTLLKRLEQLHNAIEKLTQAKAYFSLLAKAEDLRLAIAKQEEAAATATSRAQDDGQVTALDLLAELHLHVQRCERLLRADSSPIKAIPFLQAQRDAALSLMRKARITRLQRALAASNWPDRRPGKSAEGDHDDFTDDGAAPPAADFARSESVREAWSDLCHLQDQAERLGLMPRATAKPRTKRRHGSATDEGKRVAAGSDDYVPLLATQVVIEPLLLRFRYHFDGTRPTNRLDKPEWYLSHIASLIRSQTALFQPPIRGVPGSGGPIARLCRFYANTQLEGKERRAFRYIDTYAEMLHGLLTPLRRKLASSMPSLLEHPSLLAHTVFQALTFDADLGEQFPASRAVLDNAGTAKLADDILANREWFVRWLEGEKEFALRRFDEAVDAPDAWAIGASDSIAEDDEQIYVAQASRDVAEGGSKTTKSARAVVEILESVTERYRPLPSLEQRLSFLAMVQLPILRAYHQRLSKSLDAFESLSSAFARAMPGEISAGLGAAAGVSTGTSDSDMVRGLRGLGRLIKAMLSASFICEELDRWAETAFFVELSEDLQGTEEGQKLALGLKRDDEAEQDRELDAASLGTLLRRGLKRGAANARPTTPNSATTAPSAGTLAARSEGTGTAAPSQSLDDAGRFGVWAEPRRKFGEVVARATNGVEKLIVSEVLEQLRPYAHRNWNTAGREARRDQGGEVATQGGDDDEADEDGDDEEGVPTPSLVPSLSILSTHLSHLVAILEAPQSIPIYRHVAASISNAVIERVVMAGGSHRFIYPSSVRFKSDFEAGWMHAVSSSSSSSASRATKFGRNPSAPWKQLRDVATLLSLPTSSPSSASAAAATRDEGTVWTLAKATRLLFDDERGPAWEDEVTSFQDQLGVDLQSLALAR
ncbi:uncharacterized protein PFL1_06475 [Pseudozyma flocculosa PF-1]|uniref:Uncharacterized protein n=2 Tax=Pseudozyma flocculosa TaxID=84751 RepID=A0A5C3EUZ5_9BASI|nr:uncharacterized protein PFL1_06475 [Pseudozyma flocculosa PF-1]EPQ26022.1 hypothetical protein PFL1_06475 [Pseudozyma flocculosa PF-1]SPO35670.1 uncharacterized protein PSFLO_01141 [Pseudozyma flocculosa]